VKEIHVRAITGSVYVLVVIWAALSGPTTTTLLFLPVCMIAARELHVLVWGEEDGPPVFWSIVAATIMYLSVTMDAFSEQWTVIHSSATGFALMLASVAVALNRSIPPVKGIGSMLLVIVLVGVPFGTLPHMFNYDPWMFLGFMLMLWTNDTGAYIVGRSIGRTKLMPAVSPNKTVEGFAGGVALTMGVAYVLSLYNDFLTPVEWLGCGAIVSVMATLGDLFESALKRARGVKDSGVILPGHGGILDRFDGLLLAAPATLIFLRLIH
jgi:phosphatidate cytidylyltransferase